MASAHDELDPRRVQQACAEKEEIDVFELPAAAPFGTSSAFSPALEAGEHTQVKKGRSDTVSA